MKQNIILVATKMFSDLYRTIGTSGTTGRIIDDAFESYLNSENLDSVKDHEDYRKVYTKLKGIGV